MGKVVVSIPHCAWREGRPRFVPGPRLRALGFVGRDLADLSPDEAKARRQDRGWWSLARVEAWIRDELAPEIARREAAAEAAPASRAAKRTVAPVAARPRPSVVTVADLIEHARQGGKTGQGAPLRPATVAFYANMERCLTAIDPELLVMPAATVKASRLYVALEAVRDRRSRAMASGVAALLVRAWREAVRRGWGGIEHNPAKNLGFTAGSARTRAGTPAEMRALVAAADAIGLPEIGDCIVLGLFTGQRQADRLSLERGQEKAGWIAFRQAKTGAEVEVPMAPWLVERLAASAARRRAWEVEPLQIVCDEKRRRPMDNNTYLYRFRLVRAAAVAGIPDAAGGWTLEPMPSLADFRDQDLRDTFVTWANDGGATHVQVGSVSGHSPATVHMMMGKHYNERTRRQAKAAVDSVVARFEAPDETTDQPLVSRET